MTGNEIRQKYLDFFEGKRHKVIPPAPIVPLNDPTTLFTSSGMQQLVPYLKGEPHPMGTRLVDSQPCFRSEDIPEVGDNRHTTFFEMLGNWSLGDYFKKEQLPWFFEFVTQIVGLDPARLYVSVFEGSSAASRDDQSIQIWQELFKTTAPAASNSVGFDPQVKIYTYPAAKNWWSRVGVPEKMPVGEIGGPDSELFYDFGEGLKLHEQSAFKDQSCHINCDCGRFMEVSNSVFMEYVKLEDGSFRPLPAQNVDFGGGLERLAAAASGNPDVFTTDLFTPMIQTLVQVTHASYTSPDHQQAMRIIADHLKGSIFLIDGGVTPGNKTQGYFLRRLLRRVVLKLRSLTNQPLTPTAYRQLVDSVIQTYQPVYFANLKNTQTLTDTIVTESQKFEKTMAQGLRIIHKTPADQITGQFAFDLYQSFGFPLELTEEILAEPGFKVDKAAFKAEFTKHQERSRTASQGLFKSGLADHSDAIVKYHTTTHLLHQALRQVLGSHVQQMGSNITAERLRFDFKHPQKLTDEEKKKIETLINQKIQAYLPVHKTIEAQDQALKSGALAFFREKYPDQVSVYTIGHDVNKDWYSKEICGGPHVTSTGQIGAVKIEKETAVGAGVRRIYVVLAG